jgi:hypothetical protein
MPLQPIVNGSVTTATSASRLAAKAHTRPLARRCVPPPCPARHLTG